MTRRIPPPRTLLQLAAAGLVIVAIAVLVADLHGVSGSRPLSGILPGAPDPEVDDDVHVTCRRTLPDEGRITTELEDPEELPAPVGRIISVEVVECPTNFDGHVVEYVGEVVGDVLHRRGGAWVLMNDDAYALEEGPLGLHRRHRGGNSGLAVWLHGDLADLVERPGRHGVRGDVLRVEGVLRRVDPHDGGGLTLRAHSGEVIARAEVAEPPVDRKQAVAAVLLLGVALGVTVWERTRSRRY